MKVSFSKVNITPKDYIGKPLAGYTREDPCLGKLDDIHAYGVLIDGSSNDKKKNLFLLISLDLLKTPLSIVNYIKSRLSKIFNSLRAEYILIHSTHTHAAFDLTGEFYWPGGLINVMRGIMFGANRNDRYIVWFTERIINMVHDLFNKLEPCKIAWKKEKFNPNLVINRRHPTRKSLPDLGVIVFKSLKTKKLIGFIINFACHPTTLSYENNKLSADYPGRLIHRIAELTNNEIDAIYFNGPSGDLNPITTCGIDFEKLKLDKTLIYDQLGTYEHTKRIGYKIAEESVKIANLIPDDDYFEKIEFKSYLSKFLVPMKDHKYYSKVWFNNKLNYVIKKFLMNIAKFNILTANFPIFSLKRKGFRRYCESVVQNFEIKDTTSSKSNYFNILTIPGELFEEIGNIFLEQSSTGRNNTFIFQNSQDWIGYLFPLKEYIEEGGYEPTASFSPLCGLYIQNEMLTLLKSKK